MPTEQEDTQPEHNPNIAAANGAGQPAQQEPLPATEALENETERPRVNPREMIDQMTEEVEVPAVRTQPPTNFRPAFMEETVVGPPTEGTMEADVPLADDDLDLDEDPDPDEEEDEDEDLPTETEAQDTPDRGRWQTINLEIPTRTHQRVSFIKHEYQKMDAGSYYVPKGESVPEEPPLDTPTESL